jgi:nucleoside-diphosphate-sugar epimerase
VLAKAISDSKPDVIIDMICFTPAQAEALVAAASGQCQQLIFCSTVCTYGTGMPSGVLIDETFPQQPDSEYGFNKLACELLVLAAHARGDFAATVIRPSCTYGEGAPLIDQLSFNPSTWDRIARGLPVVVADSGLGLWQATHRDDVGKLFAYASGDEGTYGKCYNAVRDTVFTWRDYYCQVSASLGQRPLVLSMPTAWILKQQANLILLAEITHAHGAYSAAKAKADVPEFRCSIGFRAGAAATLADLRARGEWVKAEADPGHQRLVDAALAMGMTPEAW